MLHAAAPFSLLNGFAHIIPKYWTCMCRYLSPTIRERHHFKAHLGGLPLPRGGFSKPDISGTPGMRRRTTGTTGILPVANWDNGRPARCCTPLGLSLLHLHILPEMSRTSSFQSPLPWPLAVSSDHSYPTHFIQQHLRHRPRPLSRRLHSARSMKQDLAGTTAMLPSKRPLA